MVATVVLAVLPGLDPCQDPAEGLFVSVTFAKQNFYISCFGVAATAEVPLIARLKITHAWFRRPVFPLPRVRGASNQAAAQN